VALPETRYARNGDLHIAYQLVGDGPVDVVLLTQWFSNIDSQWDVPPLAAFIRRLGAFGRVLTFDKHGTGLSGPVAVSELPSIEEWMDDLRAVMDDSGIERAVLVANLASSFMAMVFAATYPMRAGGRIRRRQLGRGGELHHILGEHLRQPFAQVQRVGTVPERLGFRADHGRAGPVTRPVIRVPADAQAPP
jgi:pimeloyl-ACP methyl ester carboxylesterase